MEKEAGIYLFAALLIAVVFFAVYFLNVKPTGFAIFQQQSQGDFNGTYQNVSYNASLGAITLNQNQTEGTYTSQIFDSGNNSIWNNLTWNGTGNIQFMTRVCANPDCSDANFSNTSLGNINLTGRYFQYSAQFNSSSGGTPTLQNVIIDYSVLNISLPATTNVSVSIIHPSGNEGSLTSIPLSIIATGDNLTCIYNVMDTSNNSVISNQTLLGCSNSTFNLNNAGSYTFNIYANGSGGTAYNSSSFSVAAPTAQQNTTNTTQTTQTQTQKNVQTASYKITLGQIPEQNVNPGSSEDLQLSVQNGGTTPVTSCTFLASGASASWVSSDSNQTINGGASASYDVSLNVPSDASAGGYTIELTIRCNEAIAHQNLVINILQKKLDFNITSVERTRSNRVTVAYSISELAGQDQNVTIFFEIKNSNNSDVGNVTGNNSISANKAENFSINIPINSTLEGNLTLSADLNSETYSTSVAQPISLAPLGGFAIFGGTGAGSIVILVVVVAILVAIFFVVRTMRKSKKSRASNFIEGGKE